VSYRRPVIPSAVLPPDLIRGYYNREEQAMSEVRSWVDRNGLTILFTFGKIKGDERVIVDDQGGIYVEWDSLPKKKDLCRWLGDISVETLREALAQDWTRKQMFNEIIKTPISAPNGIRG
jgi:hypothetical protein